MMTVGDVAKQGGLGEGAGESEMAGGCATAEAGLYEAMIVVTAFELG